MASTKEYLIFILEQLSSLEEITYKKMMGEYLLYFSGVLFGGIYDDRLLVKITKSNSNKQLKEEVPYKGAKNMYLVDNVDDKEVVIEIIFNIYKDLREKR